MRTIANSIVFQCQRELVGKFNSKLHRMGCKILSGGKIYRDYKLIGNYKLEYDGGITDIFNGNVKF